MVLEVASVQQLVAAGAPHYVLGLPGVDEEQVPQGCDGEQVGQVFLRRATACVGTTGVAAGRGELSSAIKGGCT